MNEIKDIMQTMDWGPAPESPAPATAWLDAHDRKFGLFIGGKWTEPANLIASENPANGDQLAEITAASAEDVDAAVAAARAAFPAWSALPGYERAKYLYAIARLIQKEARLFAVLETLDNGKPIRESRDSDVPLTIRHFYHHAGWAQHLERSFPDQVPYGVCGQIIPWNFPTLMLAWKIAPALAAGNTVVIKPAALTSLTALLFAEICEKAGLPPGVVNVVTGAGSVAGNALVAHEGVDKIAFTGSTDVGRTLRTATAGSGKGLSLELGGKSPYIVFDDADIDSAIEGLVDAIWFNQGQVCCAGSRLLVQESIEEMFIAKLKARMNKLRVGDPLDKAIDIGALVAPVQVKSIRELLEKGDAEGGIRYEAEITVPNQGCFMKPMLVTNVSPSHILVREEIFGPVLVAMSFRTPDEAVALANNTRYGLAATVWSENLNLALDIAPRLKAGVVWVNCSNLFDAAAGFGGYRESGYGREGGKEGMAAYLRPAFEKKLAPAAQPKSADRIETYETSGIDRTAKMYVGGKQARGDSGYARQVLSPDGAALGEVCDGNRKDIRNAVEAARNALGWADKTGHLKAQILYFLGENLDYRRAEFSERIRSMTGASAEEAGLEVAASIERLFAFAAWADKYDGAVHNVPLRAVSMAMNEPLGVIGIAAPVENPLLGAISLVAPAIAMGNTTVLVPSELHPLAMTDFYQVLETSDVPGGVVNIVTGDAPALAKVLAEHDGIDGLWFCGSAEHGAEMERASIHNLKQVWTTRGLKFDWFDRAALEGEYFLKRATQVKNIWVPYGA